MGGCYVYVLLTESTRKMIEEVGNMFVSAHVRAHAATCVNLSLLIV